MYKVEGKINVVKIQKDYKNDYLRLFHLIFQTKKKNVKNIQLPKDMKQKLPNYKTAFTKLECYLIQVKIQAQQAFRKCVNKY